MTQLDKTTYFEAFKDNTDSKLDITKQDNSFSARVCVKWAICTNKKSLLNFVELEKNVTKWAFCCLRTLKSCYIFIKKLKSVFTF